MMLFSISALFTLASVAMSQPDECPQNIAYAKAVAHGIHSIKLSDIQYFFDSTFDVADNGIPTANTDTSDKDHPVLDNAPDFKSAFSDIGLQAMDYIMTFDGPNFMISGATLLEKIGHALHMNQVWGKAAVVYKEFVNSPPTCNCLQEDLVRNQLGTTFNAMGPRQGKSYRMVSFGHEYNSRKRREIVRHKFALGKLNGPEEWESFKLMLSDSDPDEEIQLKYLAQYLYCKINQRSD